MHWLQRSSGLGHISSSIHVFSGHRQSFVWSRMTGRFCHRDWQAGTVTQMFLDSQAGTVIEIDKQVLSHICF